LGAGIVALIVVDALLVLVFVIMFVQFRSAPDQVADDGGATSSPTTAAPDDSPSVVFASPTRNIRCTIDGDSAGCEIAHIMYEAPTLEGCEGDVGHEIEVTADGARWVCRTGAAPEPPGDDVENLDWGDSVTAEGFTCTSENDGVTCRHDDSGHAFSLARRVYDLS
jgi:hypothetical protein